MKTQAITVNGVENNIDFDAHYQVSGYRGIAFYLIGWAVKHEPITCLMEDDDGNEYEEECGEWDEVPDYENVIAVMVGDDRRHTVALEDLTVIPDESFCRECGQIGCGHNVYA
jgi:hypothetical protein